MEKFLDPQDNTQEGAPTPRVEVKPEFTTFVPQEFLYDPVGYFETEGKNIKEGKIKRDEEGRVREDPTAVKDLPTWKSAEGVELQTVGRRVNTAKGVVGESGNPFHEYEILEQLAQMGLPAAKPVAKAEQAGIHIIVMERIPGFRWSERDSLKLMDKGYSDEDITRLMADAEEKMNKLRVRFDEAGVFRSWKLKDMVFDIDIENKRIRSIVPTDWERTKIIDTENVLSSIMTAEEYSRIEHETPYTFELKVGDKELYYFGTPHSRDFNDPIFKEIKSAFDKVNPDIIFVEGMNVRGDKARFDEMIKSATLEDVIDRAGESGFTLKLGVEKGIDWRSPEPTDEDLYNDLVAKGFSKDEIFAWDVFHVLPQYHRQMKRGGFKNYVSRFIDGFRQATNWEGFDYSYERAIKLGEQIFDEVIDVENDQRALDRIDPIPWEGKKGKQTVLNRISEVSGIFRDRKIVSDIIEAFKKHKKVFVVYGASHAVMQEPAFRKSML